MVKKRANGEGNIRKRADGRWEGRYTAGYHPETGKRIIKNVLGKTQAECKAKLKKAIEESQALDVGRADEYTVAAWLRTWFELYAKHTFAHHHELLPPKYRAAYHPCYPGIYPLNKLTPMTCKSSTTIYKAMAGCERYRKGKTRTEQFHCARHPYDAAQ